MKIAALLLMKWVFRVARKSEEFLSIFDKCASFDKCIILEKLKLKLPERK